MVRDSTMAIKSIAVMGIAIFIVLILSAAGLKYFVRSAQSQFVRIDGAKSPFSGEREPSRKFVVLE